MKSNQLCRIAVLVAWAMLVAGSAWGEMSREELAKATAEYCASTEGQPVTPDMVVAKVKAAVDILNAEGAAAFPKFMGTDSEFIFAGTYIWVNDFDCVMLMHPIMDKMEGRELMSLQDVNGKRFFVEFVSAAKDGGGWVQYMWPKPGQREAVLKVSYLLPAKVDGKDVVVGCGIYDVSGDELARLNAK